MVVKMANVLGAQHRHGIVFSRHRPSGDGFFIAVFSRQ
jgi:hypothetical protein